MCADSVMLCRAGSPGDKKSIRRVPAWSEEYEGELSAWTAGSTRLADVPSFFRGDPSLVLSLRAEVEALRKEVQQLREEVEFWKTCG
jgi:hypothetical protein